MSLKTLTLLLLCSFFSRGNSKCFISRNVSYCDNLEDLRKPNLAKSVIVTGTKLEKFQELPFQSSKDIEALTINRAVNEISEDAFRNCIKLKVLTLKLNHLETINKKVFRNLNITKLFISESRVRKIEDEALTNLPKLLELRLTNNNLTEIAKHYFRSSTIKTLALSKNQISKIEKLSFMELPNLSKLYLDNNFLKDFNTLEYLLEAKNLERLWLHANQLSQITNYMLEGLTNLKVLNLGFNRISAIEPLSFAQTPRLETLVLSNNFLQTIEGSILPVRGLEDLKVLYLDHNRLMFLSTNFLFRLKSLKVMSIGGNPWWCSCLDLVLKFLADYGVELKCDKEYFSGKKPVCVVEDNFGSCAYDYDLTIRDFYENSSRLYSSASFCLL